ncbi:MAG: AAA family ATPase, partial [Spirochaetaceae bacterium]|nr:AAA family ATPase [Spirochaetaceae bacterium]
MKILNLMLKNINSLAGEWKIDFTDPAFNDGIFILHGPTGGGKTSILDALCLALYGKTSRQNSFNKTQNEVMTKGSSSCFAQVEFESGGKRYRSFWEHRKLKNGIGFQTGCTRRLYQIGDGETVLAEKISEVNDKIISIIGMDFDQFTSAVLLPQGKFDSFLTAEKKQRSEILEKISRTQIYSKIGAAVHRRRGGEDDKLHSLKDKIEEIIVLSEADELHLIEKIRCDYALREEKKLKLNIIDGQLKQYDEQDKIQKEIMTLDKKNDNLLRIAETEKARFADLEQARKAAAIADIVLQFDQAKNENEKLEAEIQKIKIDIDAAKKNYTEILPKKEAAAHENKAAENELNENEPRIKKARELDVRILEMRNNMLNIHGKIDFLIKTNDRRNADFKARDKEYMQLKENIAGLKTKSELLKNETTGNRAKQEAVMEAAAALSAFSSVSSFDDNRKSLRPGEPCPLCGSREHPFCDDEAGLLEKQTKLKNLNIENAKLKQSIANAERSLDKLQIEISRLEASISSLEAQQAANQAAMASNNEQIAVLGSEAADYEKQSAALKDERGALIMTDNIDQFEQKLKERLALSTANLTRFDKQLSEYARDTENFTKLFKEKEDSYVSLHQTLDQKRETVEAALALHGFDSYKTWKYFNWDAKKIIETERKKIELETELKNIETQKLKLDDILQKMPQLPDKRRADLEGEKQSISLDIDETNKEIGGIEKQLELNVDSKRRQTSLKKEIDEQNEICGRWKWMDDSIGGVDGWKFKNYAQALTLKSLINNANDYLLNMSSQRYVMIARQDSDELLPVIIDRYQGSIERSITNLSGGERFMLSLSLALGLSKLNSSKLSIDSLFLDEGFGTLDKASLELTINILDSLKQNQGKLTGIISHIEELHEHIAASIEVIKTGGGKSRISGCGVSK